MSLIRKIADSAWGASDGELQIGQNLPAVSSKSHKDEVIEFEGLRDEPYVFVYFYPKADTPGCTKQACSLRDAYEELCEKGVLVFGVSKDNVKDQNAFVDKYDLPFTLIADSYGEVVQAFGVPGSREGSWFGVIWPHRPKSRRKMFWLT